MLRSSRTLWTSSARSLVSKDPSTITPRPLATRARSLYQSHLPRRLADPKPLYLVHKTYFATKPANPEEEKKWGQEKLKPHPESVSTESSVRQFLEPDQSRSSAQPVQEGIAHDLNLVKETFALSTVPKESYVLGLAGTIPYLATSCSNLYLSWALNTDWPTSSNFLNSILMNHENARYWLSVIEPLQMGYGAVIISFLGAIHWGLEYAEKKPSYPRTQFRYGLGVLASVVAWPTLFMPWQFAMTSQFAAFVGLYFADSRATVRGWAPYWYGTYRFVLTAIVGVAIMLSLIGRAKIGDTAPRLSGLGEKFHQTHGEEAYNSKWAAAESEEKQRQKKQEEEDEKRKKEEEAKKKKEKKAQKSKDTSQEKKEAKKSEEGQDSDKKDIKNDEKKAEGKKDKDEPENKENQEQNS
ncbi:hypothetical protein PFICI_08467 [Pestalotiopsis fici W106-1]|uniref:Mitochondrial inner membrane protein 1 n=1 Tax=Pestalotiopsis fici (strain W106-1 / CGMCC3.15140) TaxID=1229662 RepID=W3X472_PESFW|nr:uncharacterized protein PFICI_08467 [Pestalotiopsis fici W106-1]ETS80938.1 hypothetical protein PFICI_08467 [Pestalotiopsis fici W106-1]